MQIDDLRSTLRDAAAELPLTPVSSADIRRRVAFQRVRVLSVVSSVLLVMGVVGAVAINPKPGGKDITNLVAATGEVGSARVSMTGTTSFDMGEEGNYEGTFSGEGLVDFVNNKSDLTTTSETKGTPSELEETASEHRMIGIGRDMWRSLTDTEREATGVDARWVHHQANTDETAKSGLFGGSAFDPADAIKTVDEFAERVEAEGTEDVRGVATTRYNVVLDYAWIAGQSVDSDGTTSTTESPEEVQRKANYVIKIWADGEGRLRRMDVNMRADNSDEEGSFESTSRLELYDFGVDTSSIQPPPSDQVIEDEEFDQARGDQEDEGDHPEPELQSTDYRYAPDHSETSCETSAEFTTPDPDGSVGHSATCSVGASLDQAVTSDWPR